MIFREKWGVDGDEWLPGGGSLRSKIKNCSSNGDIQQWHPLLRTFQRSLKVYDYMAYQEWSMSNGMLFAGSFYFYLRRWQKLFLTNTV